MEWTWLAEVRTTPNLFLNGVIAYVNVAAVVVVWHGDEGMARRCNPEDRLWSHDNVSGNLTRSRPATANAAADRGNG